ncbi:RING-15 protein [Coccidioides posadasii str. Silveira]|uniref:RING-15 protein n=1 Tax=Coccidioides posadasii (strain RMSCC 757 / Silveira) TaxID=443226 RepID=E9CRE8_COCPS|nr:RING-15 protein [Coccidioides posadasii str. Silveira]
MSSASGPSSNPSKPANTQVQLGPPPAAPTYTGTVETGSHRRGFANPASVRNSSAPRNNQGRKQQHKRHRRPRLVDEDALAESIAVNSTMSRKGQTSITHLMNFSLPPRPHHRHHHHHQHHTPYRPPRRTHGWGIRSGAVDKARYVHANYRFIVNPTKNYHSQATNADVHLDWDTVLQVLVSSETQKTSCPICLSTPAAPRMAKCGHIFCLPCLIRYMHSSDDSNPVPEKRPRWKKCPICWDAIYISDTRCVAWHTGQQADMLMEGGDVLLRLVWRMPGSTLALPRDGAIIGPEEDIPWYHIADVPDYARIMKGGEDYMLSHYDTEIEELKKLEHEDNLLFGEDSTWTGKAIAAVKDAKEKVKGIGNPPELSRESVERRPPRTLPSEPLDGAPDMYHFQRALKSGNSSSSASITGPSLGSSSSKINDATTAEEYLSADTVAKHGRSVTADKSRSGHMPHSSDQPYYFYQALPHFYLSPLDIRILKAEFGDFSQFPSAILPRVEHISTGYVVDDELRKRAKYLGHLPYGCEVSFLECDWTDLVSPAILEKFAPEISRRRKRNKEKAATEEKERIRAEKEEDDKRWAAVRRKRPSIGAPSNQPFSETDFQPLAGPSSAEVPPVPEATFPQGPPSPGPSREQSHSSFAALASPSSSPPTRRTVWGTAAVESSSEPLPYRSQNEVEDGWLQGWERELLLAEQEEVLAVRENAAHAAGNGKRKKNKKITLMSTNARRAA